MFNIPFQFPGFPMLVSAGFFSPKGVGSMSGLNSYSVLLIFFNL